VEKCVRLTAVGQIGVVRRTFEIAKKKPRFQPSFLMSWKRRSYRNYDLVGLKGLPQRIKSNVTCAVIAI
jgi:hypothetical protein